MSYYPDSGCEVEYEFHPQYGRRVLTITGAGELWRTKRDVWLTEDQYCNMSPSGDYLAVHRKGPGGGCSIHGLAPISRADKRPDYIAQRALLQRILHADAADGTIQIENPEPDRMLMTVVVSLDISVAEYALIKELRG